MNQAPNRQRTASELLQRMFNVEMRVMSSDADNIELLATAFHPAVVVHEPKSLPYAGDWSGLAGVRALLRKMNEAWSEMRAEGMQAARTGDTVYMTCTLHLTSRATGATVTQPFAEVLHFKDDLLIDGTPFYFDTAELNTVTAHQWR